MTGNSLNLSLKRKLDTWVGLPALMLIGLFARCAGRLLKRSHALDPVRAVLVMKFQGIGSLAIALPSLSALRSRYPQSKFIFWGSPATAGMARTTDLFNEVHVLDDSSLISAIFSISKTLIRLLPQQIDWAFDLEVYSKISSLLMTFTCARNRAGFAVDSASARADCHTHLVFFNRYRYVGESFERLFSLACPEPMHASTTIPWSKPPTVLEKLVGKPYIVVNPNVGELAPERAWPLEKFEELIAQLEVKYSEMAIVLVGKGPNEIAVGKRLERNAFNVIDLTDQLSLQQLIGCLHGAAIVVTADTSILHLAALANAKLVALFGPTLEQTYFADPTRSRSRVLSHQVFCRPCVHHWPEPPCGGQNFCMQQIQTHEVMSAIGQLLKLNPLSSPISTETPLIPNSDFAPGVVYRRPQ